MLSDDVFNNVVRLSVVYANYLLFLQLIALIFFGWIILCLVFKIWTGFNLSYNCLTYV